MLAKLPEIMTFSVHLFAALWFERVPWHDLVYVADGMPRPLIVVRRLLEVLPTHRCEFRALRRQTLERPLWVSETFRLGHPL